MALNVVNAMPARPEVTEAPDVNLLNKRQQPEAAGSSVLDAAMTIAAGESFDGKNAMYDRGVDCTGQNEGGDSDAVFILEAGASLSNVIIGPNQIEGVHCNGGCTITNVWWDAVCEDAFSIKKQADGETTTISGGGAKGAQDKVIQHNGGGTVIIQDFTVSDFGKMYRSCGNCDEMPARHVEVTGGSATDGKVLVGINPNMGDTASISGVQISGVGSECTAYNGVTDGSEPEEVGPCEDVGTGSGSGSGSATTPSSGSEPTPTEAAGDDEEAPATTSAADEDDVSPTASATDSDSDAEPTTTESSEPAKTSSGDDGEESNDGEEQSDDGEEKSDKGDE